MNYQLEFARITFASYQYRGRQAGGGNSIIANLHDIILHRAYISFRRVSNLKKDNSICTKRILDHITIPIP